MATPTSIRNKIPPITPPAIAPASDLGSKTEKLLNYHKHHTLKKLNIPRYIQGHITLTTKIFLHTQFPLLSI